MPKMQRNGGAPVKHKFERHTFQLMPQAKLGRRQDI
jgi:hypothetical protein